MSGERWQEWWANRKSSVLDDKEKASASELIPTERAALAVSRPAARPEPYTGEGDWPRWLEQFELCAAGVNSWQCIWKRQPNKNIFSYRQMCERSSGSIGNPPRHTRKILWLRVLTSNKDPVQVAQLYIDCVSQFEGKCVCLCVCVSACVIAEVPLS
jgi:hypothetical protein